MSRSRAIARRSQAGRRLVTLFALLALFLQSFAVQTHIHQLAPIPAVTQAAHAPAPSPLKSQDPIDQANCRLCQELAHSSVFVGPAATSLSLGLLLVAVVFLNPLAAVVIAAPRFSWQSRAPPR
jgi:hypothetical protein